MSLYRSIPLSCLLALASLWGCSSRAVDSGPGTPTSIDVPFSVIVDVRDNLFRHFHAEVPESSVTDAVNRAAAKPYIPEPVVRFDFREVSRVVAPDQAEVTGEFLFVVDDGPLRQGRITVVFAVEGSHWRRTGQFAVDEVPVEALDLPLIVRHSVTSEPLIGAWVEARRVEDDFRSSAVRTTDADGAAVLQVLRGEFQISAGLEGFGVTQSDYIRVPSATGSPTLLQLRPDGAAPIQL